MPHNNPSRRSSRTILQLNELDSDFKHHCHHQNLIPTIFKGIEKIVCSVNLSELGLGPIATIPCHKIHSWVHLDIQKLGVFQGYERKLS